MREAMTEWPADDAPIEEWSRPLSATLPNRRGGWFLGRYDGGLNGKPLGTLEGARAAEMKGRALRDYRKGKN